MTCQVISAGSISIPQPPLPLKQLTPSSRPHAFVYSLEPLSRDAIVQVSESMCPQRRDARARLIRTVPTGLSASYRIFDDQFVGRSDSRKTMTMRSSQIWLCLAASSGGRSNSSSFRLWMPSQCLPRMEGFIRTTISPVFVFLSLRAPPHLLTSPSNA